MTVTTATCKPYTLISHFFTKKQKKNNCFAKVWNVTLTLPLKLQRSQLVVFFFLHHNTLYTKYLHVIVYFIRFYDIVESSNKWSIPNSVMCRFNRPERDVFIVTALIYAQLHIIF